MQDFLMETPPYSYMQQWPQWNQDRRDRASLEHMAGFGLGDYVPRLIVTPGPDEYTIAARGNYRTTLQVPPNSFLVGIKTVSPSNTPQFTLNLYEPTTGRYIANRAILGQLAGGNPVTSPAKWAGRNAWDYLKSPFIVLDKGSLGVEITNLDTSARVIQVLMMFACPRGS